MTNEAYCFQCKKLVATSQRVRDVPFDDGSGIVPQISVFVCVNCDVVIAIPSSATPAIKAARERLMADSEQPII
jgi:hypothetical protein